MDNIFKDIPEAIDTELLELLVESDRVRIERIVSSGQKSPASGWYDQEQNEWVMVLQGAAILTFDDGTARNLTAGDFINIKAHQKHKVSWTNPNIKTIWLTVHY